MDEPAIPGREGELLFQVARSLRGLWAEASAPYGLTPHQARTLRTVADLGSPRLSDIAERLRITPRSATEVVDALEEADLVTRTPDVEDRRAVRVALTPEGRRTTTQVTRARERVGREYFAVLDETERATLTGLLVRLTSTRTAPMRERDDG